MSVRSRSPFSPIKFLPTNNAKPYSWARSETPFQYRSRTPSAQSRPSIWTRARSQVACIPDRMVRKRQPETRRARLGRACAKRAGAGTGKAAHASLRTMPVVAAPAHVQVKLQR